uniref:(northern house mosquito) hypothetical protein n=1 Tax=Culex pipiens TaxID=7175 RepID=A0A8D8K9B7_CULPI
MSMLPTGICLHLVSWSCQICYLFASCLPSNFSGTASAFTGSNSHFRLGDLSWQTIRSLLMPQLDLHLGPALGAGSGRPYYCNHHPAAAGVRMALPSVLVLLHRDDVHKPPPHSLPSSPGGFSRRG